MAQIGDPKGVVLTNYNLTTAAISNSFGTARGVEELSEPFRYFSFMPLSHMCVRGFRYFGQHADCRSPFIATR
jgi:long-subunit acyl-CoA synthetase (AMP-forming)